MDRSSIEDGVWAADETEFSSAVMSLNATEGAEASPKEWRVVLDGSRRGSLASTSTEEDVVSIVPPRFPTSASSFSSVEMMLLVELLLLSLGQKGESTTTGSGSSGLLLGITCNRSSNVAKNCTVATKSSGSQHSS